MKIYTLVEIDKHGRVSRELYFEHDGEVSHCGGGGKGGSSGSSTTNISSTPDYEYNKRMAAVAERQVGLSDDFFNWWKDVQAPVEEATAKSQLGLIPIQENATREFYKASLPTSTESYAGRAVADANAALTNAAAQQQRNMARMGISPNSGAALANQRDMAIAGAAQLAGAANAGRLQGEQLNLQKLTNAVS